MDKSQLMSSIYQTYVEQQRAEDLENGYAKYRGTSAKRIAEQIMKFKNSCDRGRKPEFCNAGLKKTVNEQQLEHAAEIALNKLCSADKGWKSITKNGETIYYHPDYVRNANISWITQTDEFFYDPKQIVKLVCDEIKNNNPQLFMSNVNFDSSIAIFGDYWYDGNFYSRACVTVKKTLS